MATERGAEREASFILFCTFACASCALEDVTLVLSDGAPTAEKAAATPVRADSSAAPECRDGGDPPFSPLCVAKTRRRPLWCRWWQHITFFLCWTVPACRCSARWSVVSPWPSQQFATAQFLQTPPVALPADAGTALSTATRACLTPRRRTAKTRHISPLHTETHTRRASTLFFSFLLFSLSLILSSQFLACMCQRLRKRYLCVPGEHT